mgnify:CR=1 FL=1
MYDSAKYLIHADISADGVVERSDVVGAVFGQTEGLLGDELDLRGLQESQKLGRIDVTIDSERGQSFGEITIASGLDRVETAILAAALETIERVGPCRATVEVSELEDVRSAKRREVVERATQLLAEFDEASLTSQDIVAEVREAVRVEDITEFHGFPAGPRVGESDAIIVVEGRSDVLTLLKYGVKNAIAVEGTDVPDEVAQLTRDRTVTAFLDGDRGGDLILKELAQVGEIDHVALAPPSRSVEDLSRGEVMTALREKVPFEAVDDEEPDVAAVAEDSTRAVPEAASDDDGETSPADAVATDGASAVQPGSADTVTEPPDSTRTEPPVDDGESPESVDETRKMGSVPEDGATEADPVEEESEATDVDGDSQETAADGENVETTTGDGADDRPGADDGAEVEPTTLAGHVDAVVGSGTGRVRLLDGTFGVLAEGAAEDAFELVRDAADAPAAIVVDGELSQRVLDIAAQRGVEQVVAASEGEYVKQPTAVRVRTAAELGAPS